MKGRKESRQSASRTGSDLEANCAAGNDRLVLSVTILRRPLGKQNATKTTTATPREKWQRVGMHSLTLSGAPGRKGIEVNRSVASGVNLELAAGAGEVNWRGSGRTALGARLGPGAARDRNLSLFSRDQSLAGVDRRRRGSSAQLTAGCYKRPQT